MVEANKAKVGRIKAAVADVELGRILTEHKLTVDLMITAAQAQAKYHTPRYFRFVKVY